MLYAGMVEIKTRFAIFLHELKLLTKLLSLTAAIKGAAYFEIFVSRKLRMLNSL